MLIVREFNEETDRDYEAGVAIWNANWPDYLETKEEWKAWHETRDKSLLYERLIGEIDGQIVCYGDWESQAGINFRANIIGTSICTLSMTRQ